MLRKNFKGNHDRRKGNAVERTCFWNNLAFEEQIAELRKRPGKCTKQIARIMKKIAIRDAATEAKISKS